MMPPTDNSANALPSTLETLDVASLSDAQWAVLTPLIDAQIAFMQQWLTRPAYQQQLGSDFWQWLGAQPLARYISAAQLISVINDWALAQMMSESMRADIRALLQALVYHPINDDVVLAELIDDAQVSALAQYVASHESQRSSLIHALIGNDTFTDMLTQTLYHAINDFMESTLDKAGGVGKLMKLGRSSFERATSNNLDDKLQGYLNRNIKKLSHQAESSAKAHLSNAEVARLIEMSWASIKTAPVSTLQQYLDDDSLINTGENPNVSGNVCDNAISVANTTLNRLEAGLQDSYNRLRQSSYAETLISVGIETWYQRHADDSLATLAASVNINDTSIAALMPHLHTFISDIMHSELLTDTLRQLLTAFYDQPDIQQHLKGYPSV
ncbi:hypothetical protein PSAR109036_04680 [Psychrobacter arenosus]|uniref:hypothetical protein n=1 Tax=Psychrobacter arenosus TaxID=256326 RepID=UPI001D12AE43|nr:hypothetical protein [Psychrobacter arenosus]